MDQEDQWITINAAEHAAAAMVRKPQIYEFEFFWIMFVLFREKLVTL